MGSEEKELLKQLLKKIEDLEKRIDKQEMKRESPKMQKEISSESKPSKDLFPPMPDTDDRLARAVIRGARRKVRELGLTREEAAEMSRKEMARAKGEPEVKDPMVEEIRKNYHLGEIISYVFKKKIPIGNVEEKEEKEGTVVIRE